MGIEDFELASRQLIQKCFGNGFNSLSLNAEDRKMLEYYLMSGTYGTENAGVENALNRQILSTGSKSFAKFLFIVGRMFPPRHRMTVWCELYAPALKPWCLLPVAYIWRIIHVMFSAATFRKTKNEFRNILKK